MTEPTALNKRGNKVKLDGFTFDSQKEADFYTRFIRDCGWHYEVHKRFMLQPLTVVEAPIKLSQIVYTPDFVVYDECGALAHVYDVKNSFGQYGIDGGVKLRFKPFAGLYGIPVEAVVVRAHDFKVIAQGVTKQRKEKDPLIVAGVDYPWQKATGY